ncbi:Protein of unknown function DUF985 [Penicillium griseofulvum]|uniref:DUF985 domain-containing protein n=1 Tax=Penicillium patulum TaxID=5078 RepID=A0A135LEW3_PENPA|nr:Protein of unknown function DUF985 [Penicillium griseofulvum]KXG47430.1 Protein of unknown function DUF985 [Penicillium griseofulvum]
MDISISQIKPAFPTPANPSQEAEAPAIKTTINALNLQPHPEGGYFVETDRDPHRVPNPYQSAESDTDKTRSASTTIHYLLTPQRPLGVFHRNKSRTVHVWQGGRGRYVIIHADEVESSDSGPEGAKAKARIETFVVGPRVELGEKMQWIVEGGKYKSSLLLPDEPEGEKSSGLLISEVVVPGFEFTDHDFLPRKKMEDLLTAEQVQELDWMLRTEK